MEGGGLQGLVQFWPQLAVTGDLSMTGAGDKDKAVAGKYCKSI